MNFEEIKEKLEELGDEYQGENLEYNMKDDDIADVLGKIELVDEFGGGEGQGESCHRVYHFVDHDVYVRWDGWYASGDGSHYDDVCYEVRPQQRMITFYE